MSEEELAKKANDFEEEHGWCPDYGYDTDMNVSKEEYNEILERWKADVHDIFRKMKEKK